MKKSPIILKTPARVVIAVGAIVLAVEFLLMLLINALEQSFKLPDVAWNFIDAATLTAVVSPALYFLIFRTMRNDEIQHKVFRDLLDQSTDGTYVVDSATGRFLDANEAGCRLLGYSREELLQRGVMDIQTDIRDAAAWQAFMQELRAKGALVREYRGQRKDGSQFPAEVGVRDVIINNHNYLIGAVRDITERKQAEEQIRALAFYDTLTQLPNRRLMNDRLEQTMAASKRSGRYGALLFLDLDNFKPLNDAHGHDVGDLLLVEAAHRLTRCVREVDTVARFGGDEFLVMLGELDVDKAESATQAGIVAEKIRAALAEPYMLKLGHEAKTETTVVHHCASSIGVVLFNHQARTEEIIKWADMAMYQAKEAGGNLIRFYDLKS